MTHPPAKSPASPNGIYKPIPALSVKRRVQIFRCTRVFNHLLPPCHERQSSPRQSTQTRVWHFSDQDELPTLPMVIMPPHMLQRFSRSSFKLHKSSFLRQLLRWLKNQLYWSKSQLWSTYSQNF